MDKLAWYAFVTAVTALAVLLVGGAIYTFLDISDQNPANGMVYALILMVGYRLFQT